MEAQEQGQEVELAQQRSLLNRGLRYVRTHSYAIVLMFLAAYLLFFSENNFVSLYIAKRRIASLEEKCEYYRKKIEADKAHLEQLRTDNVNLEKYAREQFYMHREGEDIYVVEEE